MGKTFSGQWVIDMAESLTISEGDITTDKLVAKYKEVKAKDGRAKLPGAKTETLWWIERNSIRQTKIVLFDRPSDETNISTRLAIQVHSDSLPTVLTPTILFDVESPPSGAIPEEHNREVERVYESLSHGELVTPWIKEVLGIVKSALQQLRTRGIGAGGLS